MVGTPNVPLGIGPPNVLLVNVAQGDSSLDLTTVTSVTLAVTKLLTGVSSIWACSIVSATSTALVVQYAFTRTAAPGAFAFANGQSQVIASVSNAVPVGSLIFPASQPNVFYVAAAVSGALITLATPYTGATNAASSASYTSDADTLGTYTIAPQMMTPGGVVPGYAFSIAVTNPGQTMGSN